MNSSPGNDSLQWATRKSGLKYVRISYQLEYLKSAKTQKFIPRGVAEQMKYTSPIHDGNLQFTIQNFMYYAGSRVHDLLIVYYTSWHNNLGRAYYSNLAKVEASLSLDEFSSFKNKLNIELAKEKEKCLKTSESKLKRDIEITKCSYIDIQSTKHPRRHIKCGVNNRRKKKSQIKCRNRTRRTKMKGVIPVIENIPEETLTRCVINLSTSIQNISHHQLYLFFLGKSYSPTPPLPDYSKFRLDILQFAYKLRWAWYWHCNPPKSKELSQQQVEVLSLEKELVKSEETKATKVCNNHCLELFLERITKDLLQTNSKTKSRLPDNLSEESRKALEEMQSWKDIVIRPADKGSKYFFLDRQDYVRRVREHIYDKETFEIVQKGEAEKQAKQAIMSWLLKFGEEPGLTDKISEWVTPDDSCKPGNNYVNPKAHKPEKDYPGRMISTGCASAIKNLSALTAFEMKKVELKYVILDLNHMLRKLDEINESGVLSEITSVIHASFDIEAMFPSISKDFGLEQCRKHLDKRINPIFSTDCITEALEITLENNITEFEGEAFRQIKGTAMGPKNACAYADIAMSGLDEDVMEGDWSHPPVLWARFRDDVYVPWTHGQELLDEFHNWLNTRIPGIKFTLKSSEQGTEFLDTFIYTQMGKLQTKPYSKPCDDHAFLVPSSCHPAHTLRNIPYSTALRIFKIASEPSEFVKAKADYTEYLKARGYSIPAIEEAFGKAESKDRKSLYQVRKPDENLLQGNTKTRVIPLVADFNPGLPNIGRILNTHKHILKLDTELCKAINLDGIFASFRGANTIHDKLVHSRLPLIVENQPSAEPEELEIDPNHGCNRCKNKCDLCKNYLKETKYVYSFHTNSVFKINHNLNCDSMNVIYIINDLKCKISSIGCTADSMKVRFRNHKSHIKYGYRNCEVSVHFVDNRVMHALDISSCKSYTASLKDHIEVIMIEQVDVSKVAQDSKSRLKECKRREWYWQNQLKTLRQYGGMNIREERL